MKVTKLPEKDKWRLDSITPETYGPEPYVPVLMLGTTSGGPKKSTPKSANITVQDQPRSSSATMPRSGRKTRRLAQERFQGMQPGAVIE